MTEPVSGTYHKEDMVCVKYPHRDGNYTDEVELGWRAAGSIYRENTGPDWARDQIIRVRMD